jgi:hypothetical protein
MTNMDKIKKNSIQYVRDTYGEDTNCENLHINYWNNESYVLIKKDDLTTLLKLTVVESGQITEDQLLFESVADMYKTKESLEIMFQIGRSYGNQEVG